MRILIDMDGVLANFADAYKAAWKAAGHPGLDEWTKWDMFHHIPASHHHLIVPAMCQPGMFRELPVIEGAQAALAEMARLGHTFNVCTTPVFESEVCEAEKKAWLLAHFGRDVARRMILTQDKTVIRADLLIDDKPEITGELTPTWRHAVFAHPYNVHVVDRVRVTWANWKDAL
jgi:5'-nucleotidase